MRSTDKSILSILEKVLLFDIPQKRQKPKPVFFVDLCCVTNKDHQATILSTVRSAIIAVNAGWYVVLAYSSGGGFMNERSTPELSTLRNNLDTLDDDFDHLLSTVFNDREAKKFKDTFLVDDECLMKRESIEVANNPYLLSCFSRTVSDTRRFRLGVMLYWDKIGELTRRFIDTLEKPVYETIFNDCLVFLECARHGVALNDAQLEHYDDSYLQRKYLTELESDKEGTKIKFLFPSMYKRIVDLLKTKFENHDQKVCSLPIVRGYVFENRFLQSKDLHCLTVSAVIEEAGPPRHSRSLH